MVDVRVSGADELRDLARDLRAAGGQALVKDLTAEIRTAVKNAIVPETRRVALATLPSRGGLARLVARSPQRVVARAGNTTATVAVVVPGKRKGTGASQADAGAVRHPTYGRRPWVSQPVRPGWFTETASTKVEAVQEAAATAVDNMARRAGFR